MYFKKAYLASTIVFLSLITEIINFSQIALAQQSPTVNLSVPIAYPARGQNPEQQQQDQFACYSWAKGQTGVDPSQPPPQPTAQQPQGGPLRRREEEKQVAQAQAQASTQEQQKLQLYYRAWTACMTGRGYSVD
jgi:hypothetical protein